jgi:hypothetical protein
MNATWFRTKLAEYVLSEPDDCLPLAIAAYDHGLQRTVMD